MLCYIVACWKNLEREKSGSVQVPSNYRRGIFLDDRFHGIDLTIVCRVSSRVTLVFHVGATFSCCDDAFSSRSFHRLKPDLQLISNNPLCLEEKYQIIQDSSFFFLFLTIAFFSTITCNTNRFLINWMRLKVTRLFVIPKIDFFLNI